MKLTHCLSALALACLPALSAAAPITYTFEVVSMISEGGSMVDNGFTLVISADTDQIDTSATNFDIVPAIGHSFTHRGTTGELLYGDLYVSIDLNALTGETTRVTFGYLGGQGDWLGIDAEGALVDYKLDMNFGPYFSEDPLLISGETLEFEGLSLNYTSIDSATFTSALGNVVPEPGSFALAGLALAGLALTRRRRA